jgi:hypothetical protein
VPFFLDSLSFREGGANGALALERYAESARGGEERSESQPRVDTRVAIQVA